MDLNVVYPSPILRDVIIARRLGDSESVNDSPSKKVQFDEAALSSPSKEGGLKKNKRPSNRDSLKTRYRRGRPGTRRHQRWMNEMYLNYDWSDLSESEAEVDIFELNQETLSRPNFSFVASYEENTEVLDDFWYNEHSLSKSLDNPVSRPVPDRSAKAPKGDPEKRYLRVSSKSRKHLCKYAESLFLQELEDEIQNYLDFLRKNESVVLQLAEDEEEEEDKEYGVFEVEPLEEESDYFSQATSFSCSLKKGALLFLFEDPLYRVMAHGVVKYYGLTSYSTNILDNRYTTVYLSSRSLSVPENPALTLQQYLTSKMLSTS